MDEIKDIHILEINTSKINIHAYKAKQNCTFNVLEQNTNNSDVKLYDIGMFTATVRSLIEKKNIYIKKIAK